jgi:DUF3011 family protein
MKSRPREALSRRRAVTNIVASSLLLGLTGARVHAAADGQTPSSSPQQSAASAYAAGMTVTCTSKSGERQECPADTSAGVALVKSANRGACVLGTTWGYDVHTIWVSNGCGGEFMTGQAGVSNSGPPSSTAGAATNAAQQASNAEPEERSSWGVFDATGQGFLVGRTDVGELKIGGYGLMRYINQLPASQVFTDHLGTVHEIDPRNDIQFHRAMIFLRGWLFSEKLKYQITSWTVMSTDQSTLFGFIGYQFHKVFNLYGGTTGIGGSRTLYGSHPFWLANDRVMADEFFRGAFTNGVWANGEVAPGLWYSVAMGNNFSTLGITAKQLNRNLATGGTAWWMPTTHEFGPSGSYDDWEYHEHVATRFGFSTARSREDRQELENTNPENTQVRLADSLLLFETGSLARNVTVQEADVRLLSFDAGMKYHGIFLQTEAYRRSLNRFAADGPLPVSELIDKGFYVQGAFYPIKQKLELYGATSWVLGDTNAGFDTSHEYLAGANFFWFHSRNVRSNFQIIDVDRSPASSTFGFYVGGQKGPTVSLATSFLF